MKISDEELNNVNTSGFGDSDEGERRYGIIMKNVKKCNGVQMRW